MGKVDIGEPVTLQQERYQKSLETTWKGMNKKYKRNNYSGWNSMLSNYFNNTVRENSNERCCYSGWKSCTNVIY